MQHWTGFLRSVTLTIFSNIFIWRGYTIHVIDSSHERDNFNSIWKNPFNCNFMIYVTYVLASYVICWRIFSVFSLYNSIASSEYRTCGSTINFQELDRPFICMVTREDMLSVKIVGWAEPIYRVRYMLVCI